MVIRILFMLYLPQFYHLILIILTPPRISSIWSMQYIRGLPMSFPQTSIHRMGPSCNVTWCDHNVPTQVHHWYVSCGLNTDWWILHKEWWYWWWWRWEFVLVVLLLVESWTAVSWRNRVVNTFSFCSSSFVSGIWIAVWGPNNILKSFNGRF